MQPDNDAMGRLSYHLMVISMADLEELAKVLHYEDANQMQRDIGIFYDFANPKQ